MWEPRDRCSPLVSGRLVWSERREKAVYDWVTPDLVRHHLQDIRDFINSRRVNTLRMAIIYAWNEWGEAAQSIEPSEANRYRYADLVRDVFQLTPNGARP